MQSLIFKPLGLSLCGFTAMVRLSDCCSGKVELFRCSGLLKGLLTFSQVIWRCPRQFNRHSSQVPQLPQKSVCKLVSWLVTGSKFFSYDWSWVHCKLSMWVITVIRIPCGWAKWGLLFILYCDVVLLQNFSFLVTKVRKCVCKGIYLGHMHLGKKKKTTTKFYITINTNAWINKHC